MTKTRAGRATAVGLCLASVGALVYSYSLPGPWFPVLTLSPVALASLYVLWVGGRNLLRWIWHGPQPTKQGTGGLAED